VQTFNVLTIVSYTIDKDERSHPILALDLRTLAHTTDIYKQLYEQETNSVSLRVVSQLNSRERQDTETETRDTVVGHINTTTVLTAKYPVAIS